MSFNKIKHLFKIVIYSAIVSIKGLFVKSQYCIINGYTHRKTYSYDDDRENTDGYQKEVYELARLYLEKNHFRSVIDFGCGSGYKLLHYFKEYETIGIDVSPTYDHLKTKYPDRVWLHADYLDDLPKTCDIIISADVIEHLLRPEELLNKIKTIDFSYLFISTPERNLLYKWSNYGPPENPTHIREWNYREFREFVSQYFDVIAHQITNINQSTQLLICVPKGKIPSNS